MCYDASSQMHAWVAAMAMGALLAARNRTYDRWSAAFLLTFSLVQLLESRIWTLLRPTGRADVPGGGGGVPPQGAYTALVPAVLWAQPAVQTYMAYRHTGHHWLLWAAGAFAALAAHALWRALATGGRGFDSRPGLNGHLVWRGEDGQPVIRSGWQGGLYLAGLFLPLLLVRRRAYGLALFAFGAATAGVLWHRYSGTHEFSSMWCNVSVLYGALALVL